MDDVVLTAILGGVCLAMMAGPLGCVLVWNRMAFFGEALAHGALLGVGMSLFFDVHVFVGVVGSSALLALLMLMMQKGKHLSNDSMLGVLSHSFLAIGLLVIGAVELGHDHEDDGHGHASLEAYLMGDIMSISVVDIMIIVAVTTVTLLILSQIWQRLLLTTFNEDLAVAEGVCVAKIQGIFMVLVACAIAAAMQYVGILLTMSLLIIPAATASYVATSPEKMALCASIVGMVAVVMGIVASYIWHVPTGPAIVVAATALLVIGLIIPKRRTL